MTDPKGEALPKLKEMRDWTSIADTQPDDGLACAVLFDDKSDSTAIYWADIGIFVLTGPFISPAVRNVTHWAPAPTSESER